MSRLISLLVSILFVVWILPLGYFVKPTQQKNFCDGQRGFCMCTMFMVKKAPSHSPTKIEAPTSSSNKEASSAGGAGSLYEAHHQSYNLVQISSVGPSDIPVLFSSMYISAIDQVPKF